MKTVKHLLLSLAFCLPFFLLVSGNVLAEATNQEKSIVRPNIIVSATIGIPKMTLWGYGSPSSIVELSGVGVKQSTNSDESGYYSFDLVYLPDTQNFPELCITAVDKDKRATIPTCIPPIERNNYFYSVGPVILPPTISLGTPQTYPESQVSAQGTTIPNSVVEIKLARPDVKGSAWNFKIVKKALAYYVPSFSVVSDAKGEYSFNIPTNQNIEWRLFSITDYKDGNKSPKSNTLTFKALSVADYAWGKTISFLSSLIRWPNILIIEIFLIIILAIAVYLSVRKKRKSTRGNKGTKINGS